MTPGEAIPGYEVRIHRAVWERVSTMGVPRVWASLWLVFCLYAGLITMTVVGFKWLLLPAVCWAIGQGTLVLLTAWDPHWDDLMIAQLGRRYRDRYEA